MNKALKMDISLLRKQFSIYGFFNILSLTLILGSLFIGGKVIIELLREPMQTYMFVSLILLISPLSDISYTKISQSQEKMMTYFKGVPLTDIQNYYLYRKLICFLIITFFFLFPTSKNSVDYFLITLFFFGIYFSISTFIERKINLQLAKTIKNIFKYAFAFFCILSFKDVIPDFSNAFFQVPNHYIILLTMIAYIFACFNIRKSYAGLNTNKRVHPKIRFKFFKDRNLLYIFRTDLIYNLIIIFLISMLDFKNETLDQSIFSFAMISSLLLIYTELLKNEDNKITIFYKANQLNKVRLSKIAPVTKFSIVYFILMVVLGVYFKEFFEYIYSYIVTYLSFVITVLSVRINVEMKNGGPVITTKNILKIIGLGAVLVIIGNTVLYSLIFN